MRTSQEAIEWIHSLLQFGIKPGLKRMELMLEELGHPERELKVVHIGGTNGKGSTVSYLKHILVESGFSVGTFTSPFIECFEERISLNGVPIDEASLVECANRLRPIVEELAHSEYGSPTEFEVITAMALDYFATIAKPDLVLLEVGLGGRLDSTNVVSPLFSIITSIGMDHMHILGNSLSEIAAEKAGIIKKNTPIISGVTEKEAQKVIETKAKECQSDYYELHRDFHESLVSTNETEQIFSYTSRNEGWKNLIISMSGPHQRENAAVALQAIELLREQFGFYIKDSSIKAGLAKTKWLGRFERINDEPLVVLDGAHNKEGMLSLANALQQHYPNKAYKIVLAATIEKDMRSILKPFETLNATFTFTTFDFFRAQEAHVLYEQATVQKKTYEENWEKAVSNEMNATGDDEMLIICGSLYFVSVVREKWTKERLVETIAGE